MIRLQPSTRVPHRGVPLVTVVKRNFVRIRNRPAPIILDDFVKPLTVIRQSILNGRWRCDTPLVVVGVGVAEGYTYFPLLRSNVGTEPVLGVSVE
jgi:hypothetical protein